MDMTTEQRKQMRFGVLSPPETRDNNCASTEEVVRVEMPPFSGVTFGHDDKWYKENMSLNLSSLSPAPWIQYHPSEFPGDIRVSTEAKVEHFEYLFRE